MIRRLCPPCRSSPLKTLSQSHLGLLNHWKRSSSSGWAGASEWTKKLRGIIGGASEEAVTLEDDGRKVRQKRKKQRVVDVEPVAKETDDLGRLPNWLEDWRSEFPPESASDRRYRKLEATRRIAEIAADRVLEPSAMALLGVSASVVLGIGAVEATMMCSELPFIGSMDSAAFVGRYAVEQLLPSCVWSTQDANLIATAMGYDPEVLLRSLDPTNAADASTLLKVQFLSTCRSMAAGFMLLAQLVRTGTIGAAAPGFYEERIRMGREPPIIPREKGMILRLCGFESDATATSLRRMGPHMLPIFEDPKIVSPIVAQHSEGGRLPVFWCVRPDRYGMDYSWNGFPVSSSCFVQTSTTGRNVLLLEADATNSDDPLSLGDQALDLTIDDVSQGFRRIQELFRSSTALPPFRTLRVYLGNSIETARSGGGHAYTLRHRVRYAKEVDVLIDSRAPVLKEILCWCDRVAKDRRVLFQTSSRDYFLSLQLLIKRYGYDIYDPLDWRMLDDEMEEGEDLPVTEDEPKNTEEGDADDWKHRSLLHVLLKDRMEAARKGGDGEKENTRSVKAAKQDTLRRLTKLSRLPRLVYYGKTAETVNAVSSLMNAGEVDAANCCALLDKREGMLTLKSILNKHSSLVDINRARKQDAMALEKEPTECSTNEKDVPQLHIVCSSTIYDDLFRQVRQWTRMGYNATQIQRELDIRYQDIIKQSQEVRETVAEATRDEETSEPKAASESSPPAEDAPQSEDTSLDEEKNT